MNNTETATKMVYVHNVSGSQLDVATLGLVLEKDQITPEAFELNKLNSSSEIKKLSNLHFIELLSEEEFEQMKEVKQAEQAVALSTSEKVHEAFFGDIDAMEIQRLESAASKVRESLGILEALISGKKVPAKVPVVKASGIPVSETEAGVGGISTKASSEGKDENAAGNEQDDDDFIPDLPPKGMSPRNDPAKKFLGFPPFNTPMDYNEKKKFLDACSDIGILKEIAVFEKPGPMKSMVKERLKEVKKKAGV